MDKGIWRVARARLCAAAKDRGDTGAEIAGAVLLARGVHDV